MTRLPYSVAARIRARAQAQAAPFDARAVFVATPMQKLEWLGSATLRAPQPGHVDYVMLGAKPRR